MILEWWDIDALKTLSFTMKDKSGTCWSLYHTYWAFSFSFLKPESWLLSKTSVSQSITVIVLFRKSSFKMSVQNRLQIFTWDVDSSNSFFASVKHSSDKLQFPISLAYFFLIKVNSQTVRMRTMRSWTIFVLLLLGLVHEVLMSEEGITKNFCFFLTDWSFSSLTFCSFFLFKTKKTYVTDKISGIGHWICRCSTPNKSIFSFCSAACYLCFSSCPSPNWFKSSV